MSQSDATSQGGPVRKACCVRTNLHVVHTIGTIGKLGKLVSSFDCVWRRMWHRFWLQFLFYGFHVKQRFLLRHIPGPKPRFLLGNWTKVRCHACFLACQLTVSWLSWQCWWVMHVRLVRLTSPKFAYTAYPIKLYVRVLASYLHKWLIMLCKTGMLKRVELLWETTSSMLFQMLTFLEAENAIYAKYTMHLCWTAMQSVGLHHNRLSGFHNLS